MKLITAVDKNWGIGKDNDLLFKLKKDLAFFKETTKGQTVIMGSNTFRSLPITVNGVLPGRHKIIMTSDPYFNERYGLEFKDATAYHTISEELTGLYPNAFVIGGARVYKDFMPYINEMYITHIDAEANNVDTYLPEACRPDASWKQEVLREEKEDGISFKIVKYTR